MRRVSAIKVVSGACVLGVLAGIGLALGRQHQDEAAIARLQKLPSQLAESRFPDVAPAEPPDGGLGSPLEGLPDYPGADVQPLGRAFKAQGEPMNVAWFETPDSVDQVLTFYGQAIAVRGHFVVRHRFHANHGYVGWFEPLSKRLHLVTVVRNQQKSLVFPSVSTPGRLLERKQTAVPAWLPEVPGTQPPLVFDFEEGANARRSTFTTIDGQSPEAVAKTYQSTLEARGYQVTPGADAEGGAVRLEATKQGSSASVVLKRGEGAKVLVYVSLVGSP